MSISANDTEPIGAFLKDKRRAHKLSQEALARLAECSTGYVRLLERGFQPAHSDVLPRVLAVLNDETPARNGRQVTTSAVVGDGLASE